MLSYENVAKLFANLRKAGIAPPPDSFSAKRGAEWEFWSRFVFLQPEELAQVEAALLELKRWPSYGQMVGIVEQVMGENMQGLSFAEDMTKTEEEDYVDYIARLGQKIYPKKSPDWCIDNALHLRVLYEAGFACAHCTKCAEGCPYGNKMVGCISKASGRLIVKKAAGICRLLTAKKEKVSEEPQHTEQYLKGQSYANGTDDFEHGFINPEVYEQIPLLGRETRLS